MIKDGNIIENLFKSKQEEMLGKFKNLSSISHPVAKGNETESLWIKWFNDNFPPRYKAEKAFIVDYEGNVSDEIDIVIYDSHYSPTIFNLEHSKFIPSESVFAVFEVKPNLNKKNIEYAIKKISSVRKLKRTSAPINTINGFQKGKDPFEIIGGLLTIDSDWNPNNIINHINDIVYINKNIINFICCLSLISCEIRKDLNSNKINIIHNKDTNTLLFAYFKLLRMFQDLGNALAIEYSKYGIEGIEPNIDFNNKKKI